MMQPWIKSLFETEDGRREMERSRLVLEATENIARVMEAQEMTKSALAQKLGRSPAFITKLLGGANNFTLRTLADVLFALGKSAHVTIGDIGEREILFDSAESRRSVELSLSWSQNDSARSFPDRLSAGFERRNRKGGSAALRLPA